MCDVRAAWCATRILALGDLRLRMQSSQFCRCVIVPSPLDRTKISGSGVERPWRVRRIVAIERQPRAIDLQRAPISPELEPSVVDAADVGARGTPP